MSLGSSQILAFDVTTTSSTTLSESAMCPCTACYPHASCFFCHCCTHAVGIDAFARLADPQLMLLLTKRQESTERENSSYFRSRAEEFLGSQDITQRLGEFYYCQALAYSSQRTELQEKKSAKATALARNILNYLILSCYGESRHIFGKTAILRTTLHTVRTFPPRVCAVLASLVRSTLEDTVYLHYSDREAVYGNGVEALAAYERGELDILPMMEAVHILLSEYKWASGSYGGESWAKIAQEGCLFLKGGSTASVFVDHIVDIVHNSGWAFDKYYSPVHRCRDHQTSIKQLLDFKKEATRPEEFADLVCIPDITNKGSRRRDILSDRIRRLT